ncbi:MAG TPA: DnaJ domain-containing protein [Xanthobacteraceae bacterium]
MLRPLIVVNSQRQPWSAPAKDLYDLIGARPDDDAEELKIAFRKAVKANHPDLYPGDPFAPVRLSGVLRAYAILRDAQERASYDSALAFEREQLRPKPKRARFGTMHNIASEAVIVAVLAVALGGGYVLLADALKASVEGVTVVEVTPRPPAEIGAVQPAAPRRTAEQERPRDKLAGVEVTRMAIAPSAAAVATPSAAAAATPSTAAAATPSAAAAATKSSDALEIAKAAPSLPEREVAKVIEESGPSIDQVDAKAATNQPMQTDGIARPQQIHNVAPSVGVELSSLENDKSIPNSSSSDPAISDQKHHMKTPDIKTADLRTPDMKTPGKPRAVAIRQTINHAPVKQASLESKSASACSESQSCSGRASPLLGVGF